MTEQVNEEIKPEPTPITIGEAPIADKPADKPAEPIVEEVVAYEPTGDTGLDMALDFIGKQGIGIDHPAMKAAQAGDFTMLEAVLAAKGVQGWAQYVALGKEAYGKLDKEQQAKAQATREAIYKEAGGEAEWAEIQKWAAANATPEEKQQINALLNQGGVAAKGAVKYLVDVYSRANNVVKDPLDAVGAVATGAGKASSGPLSPTAYVQEVQTLRAKLGGRMDGSKEYADLQRRRGQFRG